MRVIESDTVSDEEAFLRAIHEAPEDPAPRLVYADWLDERGDPRAEYLRLVSNNAASPEELWTNPRLQELRRSLDPQWIMRLEWSGLFFHQPPYKILRGIAEGALTHVLEASRLPGQRRVTLKILRSQANAQQFLNTCRIHAALRHPHIPDIYEVGRAPSGQHYAVRQFVDGEDLGQDIGRAMRTPAEVANIVTTIARTLDYCLSRGHIHSYIHPRHVLLGRDGAIWLIGFGEYPLENWIGNPLHLAPEQFDRDGLISPLTDVYLLAETAVWLLTGQHPFRIVPEQEMFEAKQSLRPWNDRGLAESLPGGSEAVLLRAMSPNPADRHPTAVEFAEAFAAAVARGPSRPWWRFW
jgi:eukaryotic-like serine/threonine-protein kinase